MASPRIQYEIVGKYVDANDARVTVGYHLKSLDGSKADRFDTESVAYLIGREQVVNCTAQVYKGKLIFKGKGITLDSLPYQKVQTGKATAQSQQTDQPSAQPSRTTAQPQQDIKAKTRELEQALNQLDARHLCEHIVKKIQHSNKNLVDVKTVVNRPDICRCQIEGSLDDTQNIHMIMMVQTKYSNERFTDVVMQYKIISPGAVDPKDVEYECGRTNTSLSMLDVTKVINTMNSKLISIRSKDSTPSIALIKDMSDYLTQQYRLMVDQPIGSESGVCSVMLTNWTKDVLVEIMIKNNDPLVSHKQGSYDYISVRLNVDYKKVMNEQIDLIGRNEQEVSKICSRLAHTVGDALNNAKQASRRTVITA